MSLSTINPFQVLGELFDSDSDSEPEPCSSYGGGWQPGGSQPYGGGGGDENPDTVLSPYWELCAKYDERGPFDDNLYITIKKQKIYTDFNFTPQPFTKPEEGVWYSCKDWLEWCAYYHPKAINAQSLFTYSIRVDRESIFHIKTMDQLEEFHRVYSFVGDEFEFGLKGTKCYRRSTNYFIDWPTLKNRGFKGVYIEKFDLETYLDDCPQIRKDIQTWYGWWDVSSGCIWDGSAILKYELEMKPSSTD